MDLVSRIYEYILEADRVLDKVVYRTPIDKSRTLSRITGGEVYLKLENLQRTGAFKVRGAYYMLWRLMRERGKISACVAASSGNHAQGVALAATELGIRSIIVMPETTPYIKIRATKSYGAEVVLHGRTYDEAYSKALEICEKLEAEFVHPFNDERVIAGQGTIGLEMLRSLKDIDVVIVPVGGGGLISGIATAIKKLSPRTKIIGVQPEGAPAMTLSFKRGRLTEVPYVDTIADGVAVKKPGDLTFKIISELVDDMVLVSDDEIVRAIFFLLERSKCVAEPAGALGVAALLGGRIDVRDKRTVVLISGGNMDMLLLARVIERALVLEKREIRIQGILPDRPGMLKTVLEVLAQVRANVVSIEHDRIDPSLKPGTAKVTIIFELPSEDMLEGILKRLREKGLVFRAI
ncbi:MAG: threonine ammonia-lyase [Thermoprotei archaeon]|nr:MAG: threonine ammonia-lyase [Thermoprotei archaeon]